MNKDIQNVQDAIKYFSELVPTLEELEDNVVKIAKKFGATVDMFAMGQFIHSLEEAIETFKEV